MKVFNIVLNILQFVTLLLNSCDMFLEKMLKICFFSFLTVTYNLIDCMTFLLHLKVFYI